LKLNPTIDDIQKQLVEELEAIREALEMGFEYLDHPLSYRQFKDQVAIVMNVATLHWPSVGVNPNTWKK
jgi:hypothetical protein